MKKHTFKDTETLDGLLNDWFDRDETAVTKSKEARLGWEETLKNDSSLSEFFMKEDLDVEEKYTKIHEIGKDYLSIIGVTKPLKFLPTYNAYTDNKTVTVGTSMFEDKKLTFTQALDIFTGLTIHEGFHNLYTTFGLPMGNNFIKSLANIIEDERIEIVGGEEFPGFLSFISKTKEYAFKEYPTNLSLTLLQRFLNVLCGCIRYPLHIDKKEVEEFGYYLLRCKEFLNIYPLLSTEDSITIAEKIFEVAKDLYEDEKKEKEQQSNQTKKDNTKKQESNENTENEEDSETEEQQEETEEDEEEDSENTEETETTEEGDEEENEELKNDIETVEYIENEPQKAKELAGMTVKIIDGDIERGKESHTLIMKPMTVFKSYFTDIPSYGTFRKRMSKYIPSIRKTISTLLEERETKFYGMRNGKLDPSKLVEAIQGVPNVYTQQHKHETQGATIVLLMDESGSMYQNNRYIKAIETAVLINESLKGLKGVDLYIYGHTACMLDKGNYSDIGNDKFITNVLTYREGGKFVASEEDLTKMTPKHEGRDGYAIREVAHRVRKFTQEKALFIVVSDGQPNASGGYVGYLAREDTRKAVEDVRKLGFDVTGVTIDGYRSDNLYPEEMNIKNVADLPVALSRYIKKYIVKRNNGKQ